MNVKRLSLKAVLIITAACLILAGAVTYIAVNGIPNDGGNAETSAVNALESRLYKSIKPLLKKKIISVKYEGTRSELISPDYIVVHYVANPSSTAEQNYRFFASHAAYSDPAGVNAHFIVGLDGEIIQCLECDSVAWAVGDKNNEVNYNYYSISIECCHPDETGRFTDATYSSLVRLVSYLAAKYGIPDEHIIRHYDISSYGKKCPLYFVDNPGEWEKFKAQLITE